MADLFARDISSVLVEGGQETLNAFKENALSVAKQFDIHNVLPLYESIYYKAIEDSK